jgi:hypothetical protein
MSYPIEIAEPLSPAQDYNTVTREIGLLSRQDFLPRVSPTNGGVRADDSTTAQAQAFKAPIHLVP